MRATFTAVVSATLLGALLALVGPVPAGARTEREPVRFRLSPELSLTVRRDLPRVDTHTLLVKYGGVDAAIGRPSHELSARELTTRAARFSARPARPIVGSWVAVSAGQEPGETRRSLEEDPRVVRVSVDRVRQTQSHDPAFQNYQEYLRGTMDFPQAWGRSSGAGVTVAVVDSGVDASHPDLGRVLRGRDFVDNDRVASDQNGHGTFVSGIIAAQRGNHRGIAGASRASILPVRVMNARGVGRDSDVAAGIRWATNNHADIINLSLGGPRPSRVLRDAIAFADQHGVLVIASGGNGGTTERTYPASYPTVVAVGATDSNDRLTWFSQRGGWVDLVAPGWKIASTVPGNRYAIASGTSFSAPLVTAAAALILDEHPRWSPEKTRAALQRDAADAGPVGPDPFTGFGVLDVDGALGGVASMSAAGSFGGSAVTPATARILDRSENGSLNPEGAGVWFVYQRSSTADVIIEGALERSAQGVLRGDLVLEVYDANLHSIRRVDRQQGAGAEKTTIRVSDVTYVRVSNTSPTRSPGSFRLLTSATASGGQATVGSGPKPLVLNAEPRPNATGVNRGGDLSVTLGRPVAAASITAAHVQLIDGSNGAVVDRSVSFAAASGVLVVDPDASLVSQRDYVLVLSDLRSTQGTMLPGARIGFRTG